MSKASKRKRDNGVEMVKAIKKQYGEVGQKNHGAVKVKFKEQPRLSFRYVGLTVEKDWPVKLETQQRVHVVGSPKYEAGQVLHFSVIVPKNQFWK